MAREGQGYPCYQRDMMMMMIYIYIYIYTHIYIYIWYKNVNKRLLLLLLNKYFKIPLANVVRLSAERSEILSNVKLDGFRSRLRASCVSSHTDEF